MVLIQVDLPVSVDEKIGIYRIKNKLNSKSEAIVKILKEVL